MHTNPEFTNVLDATGTAKGMRLKEKGVQEADEVAPPHVQFTYLERKPQLPFPILTPTQMGNAVLPEFERNAAGLSTGIYPTRLAAAEEEEDFPMLESSEESDSVPSTPELKLTQMTSALPAFSTTTQSVWDMPMRGSRDAPKTFRGHHTEVEYFIVHYDKLLVKYRVVDPYDRCECILDYCSTDVQGFIRASENYQTRNWVKLRKEILKCYDVDRATSRYKPSDIAAYTLKTQTKPFQNLLQWKRYFIKYKTMAGTLLQQGVISRVEVGRPDAGRSFGNRLPEESTGQ
jgi:hypothetical protein